MRKSKLSTDKELDPVRNRTIRVSDSIWKALQIEGIERRMSVSDILVEAVSRRLFKFVNAKDQK